MIQGAIDSIHVLPSGGVRLGGWATFDSAAGRLPVEIIEVAEGAALEFTRFKRADFAGEGEYGFYVTIPNVDILGALYFGSLNFIAKSGAESGHIPVWSKIRPNLAMLIADKLLRHMSDDKLEKIIEGLQQRVAVMPSQLEDEACDLPIQIGASSLDGSVVVGREGYLFLYKGRNSLHSLYSTQPKPEMIEEWSNLIKKRNDFCTARGIKFLQFIVPEKQSILDEFYPVKIDTPTAMLSGISKNLDEFPFYINGFDVLKNQFINEGVSPFRRVDTHLTFFGAMAFIRAICGRLGNTPDIWPRELSEVLFKGDLGSKIFRGNIYEKTMIPKKESWKFAQIEPKLEKLHDPADSHVGSIRQWSCDSPVFEKHIVIFGNSVFERGDLVTGLSWWCSRIFRKTTFIWSAGVIEERVREWSPDIIVAQTVERFLTSVPAR